MKRKYTLDTVPKYINVDEFFTWPEKDLEELYKQCKSGRTCYLNNYHNFDAYYEGGLFSNKVKEQIVREAVERLNKKFNTDIKIIKLEFRKGPTGDYKSEQTITSFFFDSYNIDSTAKLELGEHWFNIEQSTLVDQACKADKFVDKKKVILRIAYKVLEKYKEHEYPF